MIRETHQTTCGGSIICTSIKCSHSDNFTATHHTICVNDFVENVRDSADLWYVHRQAALSLICLTKHFVLQIHISVVARQMHQSWLCEWPRILTRRFKVFVQSNHDCGQWLCVNLIARVMSLIDTKHVLFGQIVLIEAWIQLLVFKAHIKCRPHNCTVQRTTTTSYYDLCEIAQQPTRRLGAYLLTACKWAMPCWYVNSNFLFETVVTQMMQGVDHPTCMRWPSQVITMHIKINPSATLILSAFISRNWVALKQLLRWSKQSNRLRLPHVYTQASRMYPEVKSRARMNMTTRFLSCFSCACCATVGEWCIQ